MPTVQLKNELNGPPIDTLTFQDKAENYGGPVYSNATDASRIERPIQCKYGDIKKAVKCFLGYSLVDQDVAGHRFLKRFLPNEFPRNRDLFNQPWLYATAFQRIDGVGVADHYGLRGATDCTPKGQLARGTVLYTSLPYELVYDDVMPSFSPAPGQANPLSPYGLPDEATLARFCEIDIKPSVRTITLPRPLLHRCYETGDTDVNTNAAVVGTVAGPPIMEGVSRQEGVEALEITHHQLPYVPLPQIEACMGTANAYPINLPPPWSLTLAARVYVYQGAGIRPIRLATGVRAWTITHRWRGIIKIRKDGTFADANQFLQVVRRSGSESLDYRRVTADGLPTGDPPFPLADHAQLFRP